MSNPVRWFIDINKKCFEAVAKLFPNTKISIDKYYTKYVREISGIISLFSMSAAVKSGSSEKSARIFQVSE